MRRLLTLGVLAVLMGVVASEAQGQRPFAGGGGFNLGSATLLLNKGVREELKITDEQKEKLDAKAKDMFAKRGEIFGKLKDIPKEEFAEKMQKMLKEAREAADKEVAGVLTADQVKRLKQIERQQDIPATLTTDETTVEALKVTSEQRDKIKEIAEEGTKERTQLMQQFSKDNPRETFEKIAAARKETNEKAVKVLTGEQQTKWKELAGEPFEVKQEFGGGGFFKGKGGFKKPSNN